MAVAVNFQGVINDLLAAVDKDRMVPYPEVPGGGPELPGCYVGLPNAMSDFASTGSCSMSLAVTVFVGRGTSDLNAQIELADLLDVATIAGFLNTRSDNWSDMAFTGINNFRQVELGTTQCYAADINLQLRTT